MRRSSGTRRVPCGARRLVGAALAGLLAVGAYTDDVARGDAAWDSRAEGERDGRPRSAPILDAVRSYERALDARPESLAARWKLLRALHFAGDFASQDAQAERRFYARAREISEAGLDLLAAEAGAGVRLDELGPEEVRARLGVGSASPSDVARLYFWSAINWASWGQTVGVLAAVRQGVAARVHRYTRVALALEPGYDEGGPLRLMGRLHAEVPRVPFLTGWVDRDQAIPMLERAKALAPHNPGNQLLLALTLLELAPARSGEALELLKRVEALTPRASMRIEDLAMREQARERLASLPRGSDDARAAAE